MDLSMISLDVVGYVRVNYTDEYVKEHSGEVEGIVEVLPKFTDALEGIEEYSHIFLISYLHKQADASRNVLKVRPRRLLRMGLEFKDLPIVGVFATDSPTRPNPVGLTLVKLLDRKENLLHVWGLDLFNETPIIDIKPYSSSYRASEYKVPLWASKFDERKPI
ncbi:MAG: tRNA (N6-threonylcarbamoyladenosine(37)-N6)-methyltransferase TrmO [Nitrososphaerota archaeon]